MSRSVFCFERWRAPEVGLYYATVASLFIPGQTGWLSMAGLRILVVEAAGIEPDTDGPKSPKDKDPDS